MAVRMKTLSLSKRGVKKWYLSLVVIGFLNNQLANRQDAFVALPSEALTMPSLHSSSNNQYGFAKHPQFPCLEMDAPPPTWSQMVQCRDPSEP